MSQVISRPSNNWNERPFGSLINAVIMHATESNDAQQDVAWLQSALSKASAHVVIDRDGTIYDLVPVTKRAWHAGVSSFDGVPDCNNYAIGVELANRGDGEPYPDAQLEAAACLVAGYLREWPAITLDRITCHKDVALPPGRKHDPQPPFDIEAFRNLVAEELER